MNRFYKILLLGFVVSCGTGCMSGRLADLADCGKLSIGVGTGLEIYASLGGIVQPALGVGNSSRRIGHESRDTSGYWIDENDSWPVQRGWKRTGSNTSLLRLTWSGDRSSGMPLEMNEGYWLPVATCFSKQKPQRPSPLSIRKISNLEIGATLGFFSLRAGVNPLEILDFFLGFVGLDISGDDSPKKDKVELEQSSPAAAGQ